jgi:3-deoxy-D-manno-octulosonate 8-phosphate phosphatase (KDO 8-P phosphatase)
MPLKMDEVQNKIPRIKIFLFDLQGVLIPEKDDGSIDNYLIEKLSEFRDFCEKHNLTVGIITGITEGKILDSIKSLDGIELVSATLDKVSAAERIATKKNLTLSEVFFMGDGLLDVPLLSKVGLSAAPESAARQIKKSADFVCPGKNGVERLEYLLSLLKKSYVEV